MRAPSRSLALLTALVLSASCGSDSPGTPGSIAISVSPSGAAIDQGKSTSVTVTLARTNYTGDVSISASGMPSGVTVTPGSSLLSGGVASTTFSINAGATATVGTSTITFTASGNGVDAKSASFPLTVTPAPVASYTMTIAPASASVAQGASTMTTVTLARSNFTGSVALAATGLPAGATATYSQPGTTSSGAVTINSGTAAVGTYSVTITGTAGGMTNVTAPFALTVTAAPTPTTISYAICGTAPVWFGYQSGTSGAWTTVAAGANNTYTFSVAGVGGVAYVTARNGNASTSGYYTFVMYGSAADLQANGASNCYSGAKTVNGSAAGLGTGDQAEVNLSRSYTYATTNGPWTLTGVPNGSFDLLSSLLGANDVATKVIIRRAQNPADNATLPVLDFSTSEAIATTPMTLSFTGLSAVQPNVFTELESATGTATTLSSTTAVGGNAASAGVPPASLAASDLQSAFAFVGEGSALRAVITYYHTPGNKTIAFGPTVSTPTASTVATTPYARPQVTAASQSAYGGMAVAEFHQGGSLAAPSDRVVDIFATPGYFGGTPATWTIAMPDFSAASGFNNAYELASGVSTTWAFYAYSTGNTRAAPTDGDSVLIGAYQGTMVPASAGTFTASPSFSSAPSPQALVTRLRRQQRTMPILRQR